MKAEMVCAIHRGQNVLKFTDEDQPRYAEMVAGLGEGEVVEVEFVRLEERSRSLKQNAALHAALTRWVVWKDGGLLTTAQVREQVEQVKDDLLALLWGYIVRQNQFTGEITKTLVKAHTSKLSRREFCDLFDQAVVEAAKDGYEMALPDEYLEARREKREKDKAA